ncbi:LysR family transcriptional regulator [Vibrio mexicanus]|uniref:LysR family transcriptional regulator n=1 Tax=Vibrio mexicanus TaxID=1004326 RepID=UPI00063C968C|nr:LysR family transcriptional regulator [Vibrio mexicanus]
MHDLNALHVFLTLMQCQSTQRAARKLGRSQSYISKVLAQLREDLDDPLFTRSNEGLSPTSYAISIEPKLRKALESVNLALEPATFSPDRVDKVTIHMAEPYVVAFGKKLIQEIRKESDALIELRTWNKVSESMIIDDEVDIGLHVLTDKPQTIYQRRVHTGSAYFNGNEDGDYIKFIVSGFNDHTNYYHVLRPDIEERVIVDNYSVMTEMMDIGYTLRYHRLDSPNPDSHINIEIALIMKASKRHSPKLVWLSDLITRIVNA